MKNKIFLNNKKIIDKYNLELIGKSLDLYEETSVSYYTDNDEYLYTLDLWRMKGVHYEAFYNFYIEIEDGLISLNAYNVDLDDLTDREEPCNIRWVNEIDYQRNKRVKKRVKLYKKFIKLLKNY